MTDRGGLESEEDDRIKALRFHKQLESDRVVPLNELKHALRPFQDSELSRESPFGKNLDIYLDMTPRWGNLRYRSGELETILSYSPWEYVEHDNLLNGRMNIVGNINDRYDPDSISYITERIDDTKFFDSLMDGSDLATITIPSDAHIPQDYSDEITELTNIVERA